MTNRIEDPEEIKRRTGMAPNNMIHIYAYNLTANPSVLAQTCHLHSIANPGSGSLTAQKRMKKSELTGFSFVRCLVTGNGPIYLGRAWGPYSRVVFLLTEIDVPIYPAGWFNWGDSARQK
jgi:hypothetical protein